MDHWLEGPLLRLMIFLALLLLLRIHVRRIAQQQAGRPIHVSKYIAISSVGQRKPRGKRETEKKCQDGRNGSIRSFLKHETLREDPIAFEENPSE